MLVTLPTAAPASFGWAVSRQVRAASLVVGIVFLTGGVLTLLGNLVAKGIVGGYTMWADAPARLRELPSQLLAGFLAPLDIYAIVLAAIGVGLLVVFFVYRPQPS